MVIFIIMLTLVQVVYKKSFVDFYDSNKTARWINYKEFISCLENTDPLHFSSFLKNKLDAKVSFKNNNKNLVLEGKSSYKLEYLILLFYSLCFFFSLLSLLSPLPPSHSFPFPSFTLSLFSYFL